MVSSYCNFFLIFCKCTNSTFQSSFVHARSPYIQTCMFIMLYTTSQLKHVSLFITWLCQLWWHQHQRLCFHQLRYQQKQASLLIIFKNNHTYINSKGNSILRATNKTNQLIKMYVYYVCDSSYLRTCYSIRIHDTTAEALQRGLQAGSKYIIAIPRDLHSWCGVKSLKDRTSDYHRLS